MANPFTTWIKSVRFSAKTPIPVDSFGNKVLEGIDWLATAVEAITDPTDANALKGAWTDPLFLRASDTVWLAEWLDDTDTSNIVKRMKSGTSKANATPSSKTDGVVVGGGGFI